MRKSVYLFFICTCFFIQPGKAQKYYFPSNPETFIDTLQILLQLTNNENSIFLGTELGQYWGNTLGPDLQDKVINHFQIMDTKGLKLTFEMSLYLKAISNAISIENLEHQKLVNFLNTTGQVIELNGKEFIQSYLKSMSAFFEYRTLYHSKHYKLFIVNDSYDFEYIEAEVTEEPIPEPVEEEAEEEMVEEINVEEEFEDWDTQPADEDWGTEWGNENEWGDDESGDSDINNDKVEEKEEDLSYLIQDVFQPTLKGAIIRFDPTDLIFVTPVDSSILSGVAGALMIKEKMFVADTGRFSWENAGLGKDSVYVDLSKYNFKIFQPIIHAERVHLTYKGKLEQPIEGIFEYNGKASARKNQPRFMSYNSNIPVKGIAKENVIYKGGFSLNGSQVLSSSIFGGLARIDVLDEDGKKFTSRSKLFKFNLDSTISAQRASIVIYHGYDSIYHPTIRLHYNSYSEYLTLQKDKGGFKNTPYESSYFNIDFTADIIRWKVNSDSLDVSILNAREEIPSVFESKEFFNLKQVTGAIGLWDFNPLQMAVGYSNIKQDPFYVYDLAAFVKKDVNTIKTAMFYLMWAGYIDYNVNSGLVSLKDKAKHSVLSKRNKKDYDNLRINSLTAEKPNGTLNFSDQTFRVRGIDRFYISEILDVYIEPDSNEVILLENRGFKFDGKIFAGNFEYIGHDFEFNYDEFTVKLNQIDSIQFYIIEEDSRGSRRRKINNALAGAPADSTSTDSTSTGASATSGTLFINRPDNKSSRKMYPDYPKFDGEGTGSIVFFDRQEYLNGVYDKSIYFNVPPFKLDSLSDSDPSSIGFAGTFGSSGMFPDIRETLKIQPDYSLGFQHMMPPEGYQLFQGPGRIFGDMSMDQNGLRTVGKIDYLSTTLESEDFVFYIDMVESDGAKAEIREETISGITYPDIQVENYHMRWLPKKDSMYISNNASPIQLYENTTSLDGTAIVSSSGVYGSGELETRGAIIHSNQYHFKNNAFSGRHADLTVSSNDAEKPALLALNSTFNFDLVNNAAQISPEIAGEAILEFPFSQFKTSIPNAVWYLDSSKVIMKKPDEYKIEDSYFYTTRPELDSLVFNATDAVYDIKKLELKVSGIPYITVADARITPENGEVLVLENSRIGTLRNTKIVIDTLNEYHRLYDGTINIISRNEFEGDATYELINAVNDTFAIKLTNFRLEDLSTNKRKQEFHTVANGNIPADSNLIISPGMYYKGDVKMFANRQFLELNGFVKLNLKKIQDYDTWIAYTHDGEQGEVVFNFDESITENGQKVTAGLHFDLNDYSLYSTFITDKRSFDDENFFTPSGNLKYLKDSTTFIIIDEEKEKENALAGKVFEFNEESGNIRFEGPISFIENRKGVTINAAGIGKGNIETNEFEFSTLATVNFDLPVQAYELIAADFTRSIQEFGAPEAIIDPTSMLYKLAELIGNRAAESYEQRSVQEYVPLASTSNAMVQPMVFSDLNMAWSDLNKAFYSKGQLGMSNIIRHDLNAGFEGYFEITKSLDGEKIDLFIKAGADSWYYFGFEGFKLITFSSNSEYNALIKSKSNAGKAKLGEFVFSPGDIGETIDFIQRFRADYLGLFDPYELNAPVEQITDKVVEDFGAEEKDEGFDDEEEEEDDDDEGF